MSKNTQKTPKTSRVSLSTLRAAAEILQSQVGDTAHIPGYRIRLYLVTGPGKRGKTAFSRHLVENSIDSGSPLHVFDLEGVNLGLRASHPDECETPEYVIRTGAELAEWLYPKIEEKALLGQSMLVDLEGNDARIVELCEESDLLEVLESLGVTLVVVALTGGADDDIALLSMLVAALGERSYDLVIVVAERLLPSHRKALGRLEEAMFEDENIKKAMEREGSGIVYMPTCDQIAKLDHTPTTYRQASRDKGPKTEMNPLALFERSMLRRYLEKVDARLAEVFACRR